MWFWRLRNAVFRLVSDDGFLLVPGMAEPMMWKDRVDVLAQLIIL